MLLGNAVERSVLDLFKVLSQHLYGGAEEKYEKTQTMRPPIIDSFPRL